jgi:hypothetical protein
MKILVTESQYKKLLKEEEKEQKILRVPGLDFFHKNPWEAWKILQKVLEVRGNPPYTIDGDLDLRDTPIKSLGNLQSVGHSLDLMRTSIESLGNLTSVGGYLDLDGTPLSKMYTEKQIRKMVNVVGEIYL